MSDSDNDRTGERISEIKRERYREADQVSGYDLRYQHGINRLNTLVERTWIGRRLTDGPVLDAGAGTGRFSAFFADSGHTVTALDSSQGMLDKLRAKSPEVETVLGDIYTVPFEDGRFDNVVCMHVLFHLPDWQRVVAELARVLRPGGRLFFEMRNSEHAAAFSGLARRLGKLDGNPDGTDQSSATLHVDRETVARTLEPLGVEISAVLRYDFPHSYWFRPLARPAGRLLEKSSGVRTACSRIELAAGKFVPAALAYRTLYEGRKR